MPRYDTILFDLDGTLIDSVDLIVESYRHAFRVHRLPEQSRETILAGIGRTLKAVFGEMTDDPARIEAWIATYREYNLAHHDAMVHPFPGAVAAVHALRAKGHRLGLVTSKNRSGAERGLAHVGLSGTMEVIVGADDVIHPKPHPEPVERALAALNAPTARCVFVGDSRHDIQSGRAAGVHTAGVTWGPFDRAALEQSAPDHICDTAEELLAIIGG